MHARFESLAMVFAWTLPGCGPAPITSSTFEVLDASIPATALACDGDRAAVITPDGFALVRAGDQGVTVDATVTGVPLTLDERQGSARLADDRLVVARGEVLEIFDLTAAPSVVVGSVPMPTRGAFDLVGHTLYAGDTSRGIVVYDITDVTAPQELDHFGVGGDGPSFLRVHNGVLYALDSRRSAIYAIALDDPHDNEPPSLAAVGDGMAPDGGDYRFGPFLPVADHLYLNVYQSGLGTAPQTPIAIDISDPARLVLTQGFEEPPPGAGTAVLPQSADGQGGIVGIGGIGAGYALTDPLQPRGNASSPIGAIDLSNPDAPSQRVSSPLFDIPAISRTDQELWTTDICFAGPLLLHVNTQNLTVGGTDAVSNLIVSRRR